MDAACPRCEGTKTVAGRCLGRLDAGAGFVFRPDDLSFFSIMGTDLAIGDRATACIECGLMWLEVPADKLKRIIARKGKNRVEEPVGSAMSYFCQRIERMAAYVPGEQPETADVIKINTNENPYPPSPQVLAAIRAVREEHLRRYPNPTSKPFRSAAARLFGVAPDMVICSNGMDELLRMLIQACCEATRPLGYPTPTYSLYSVLAETIGAPVRSVPFPAEFSLPVEHLAATDARLFLVVNPNAPTGTFAPIDEIARLAKMVEGRAIVGVDEAYVNFARDNALRLVRQCENVIVLRTLSKGYSLAGLRFGFAIAPERIIAMLNKVKDSYNLDVVAIAAATAAITDNAYAEATWQKVIDERNRLVPKLRELGFAVVPSESNFILATAPPPGAETIYKGLKDRNILIRWWSAAGLSDKVRITVGTPEQNAKLLQAIREILAAGR